MLQGLTALMSNPVMANGAAGLAISAQAQATLEVRFLPIYRSPGLQVAAAASIGAYQRTDMHGGDKSESSLCA